MNSEVVLSVRNLSVDFKTDDGVVHAVDDLSFDLARAETLGIVGESGSGKSVTSLAIMGLLPQTASITGEATFDGRNLARPVGEAAPAGPRQPHRDDLPGRARRAEPGAPGRRPDRRGDRRAPRPVEGRPARPGAVELLDLVGIPQPIERAGEYPHEYSGGMRQRAMIAMAIANDPDVLIADEPTTALDVTIQAQVLDVLERIQERTDTAIVLITHDLGVVAGVADRVLVMYAGRQAELGSVDDVFYRPSHPYTRGLLASLPRLDRGPERQRLHRIKGQPPSMIFLPPGCAFHPRCPYADLDGPCATTVPDAGHRRRGPRVGVPLRDVARRARRSSHDACPP